MLFNEETALDLQFDVREIQEIVQKMDHSLGFASTDPDAVSNYAFQLQRLELRITALNRATHKAACEAESQSKIEA